MLYILWVWTNAVIPCIHCYNLIQISFPALKILCFACLSFILAPQPLATADSFYCITLPLQNVL